MLACRLYISSLSSRKLQVHDITKALIAIVLMRAPPYCSTLLTLAAE